jgi:hypothetical protein
MRLPKVHRLIACTLLLNLIGLAILTLDASQATTSTRGVRLRFADGADLRGLSIQYQLVGSFGGYGSFLRTSPDVREYVVETSRDGQPATTLKAIVYCPGYRIVLVNESDLESRRSVLIDLKPLGSVPLSGQLVSAPIPLDLNIEALYLAYWSHSFFRISDGPVAQFTVATSKVAPDGSFSFNIPDLAHDPVVASFPEGTMRGEVRLMPREAGTGNIPYHLEIHGAERGFHLPVAAEYPRDLLLVGAPR